MEKEILTMEEAAELFSVSIKTFIKLLKEEKVPGRKIGREWRFSRKALIDWLSSGDSQVYSSSEGDTKEYFNEVAPVWEEIRKDYYDESIKDYLVGLNILKKNMTIIDLGSGNGYISVTVANYVKKVIAVDISREMLKELKNNALKSGIRNIQAIESDGRNIPIKDNAVDFVCTNMYLHHIEEPFEAIKEMGRVLKAGGMVFLADYKEHSNMELKEKMHDVWPGFNPDEVKKWFLQSGFNEINIVNKDIKDIKGIKDKKDNVSVFLLTAVKHK